MINSINVLMYLERQTNFRAQDILILLGPTASGKTKLAVQLARSLNAEIISADSRQVYRGMDIGTGKDIQEYEDVPYHLIDIVNPGEQYNVSRFLADFEQAYGQIKAKGKQVIVCGGTGFYIQALLTSQPYNQIPTDIIWREQLERKTKAEIEAYLSDYTVPEGYLIDYSSKKRMVRALEVLRWLSDPIHVLPASQPIYTATILGLDPAVEIRRQRISRRLHQRLEQGMVEEVEKLLDQGVTYEQLAYYGLEYKYISYYLQDKLTYEAFVTKLETEIHRYAKRQMTYLRKMEKDGVDIQWIV
ncbi:tRNA (adenosine(37)-N6)-dimethylallyltransferase MiaA [Sphingobacterium sp. xlx-130]|uniref:tRNA (adenosine(37)-N6)-dimethylallyltransferase MiaA n=1 Tax=Sphingobacterium sp. xlx-130 TaxID=2654323 RepID=UPI001F095F86|nr:tRNA (adenosine(37)-N6)-dimethylallyltransferase MiaA [Sphingobacterium sp. xlx-130]